MSCQRRVLRQLKLLILSYLFCIANVYSDTDGLQDLSVEQLLNVEVTGPWGHNGAYTSLEAITRHMLDPIKYAKRYNTLNSKLTANRSPITNNQSPN